MLVEREGLSEKWSQNTVPRGQKERIAEAPRRQQHLIKHNLKVWWKQSILKYLKVERKVLNLALYWAYSPLMSPMKSKSKLPSMLVAFCLHWHSNSLQSNVGLWISSVWVWPQNGWTEKNGYCWNGRVISEHNIMETITDTTKNEKRKKIDTTKKWKWCH